MGAATPVRLRLLFCSWHCYLDSSSGAALCTRDLLELLTARGWPCRVLCGQRTDSGEVRPLADVLALHGLSARPVPTPVGGLNLPTYQAETGGVPLTIYAPPDTATVEPTPQDATGFLALLDRELERFRPEVLLTYGGQAFQGELMARAKRSGTRVVFAIHNLAYHGGDLLRGADAHLVPSRFAAAHYQRTLGLECATIPGPWKLERVECGGSQRKFVTFVNPEPAKGVFVFARIAGELARRRPDIPFLVVEGRGGLGWLGHGGLELRGSGNVFAMNHTSDPREFYRLSKLVLLPSLVEESFPRVAAEALINGIPVLASDRGGTPEVLEQAGRLFDIPTRYTPDSRELPTAEEVEPWLAAIIDLWDRPAVYQAERRRCLAAARAWRPQQLVTRFEGFLRTVESGCRPE